MQLLCSIITAWLPLLIACSTISFHQWYHLCISCVCGLQPHRTHRRGESLSPFLTLQGKNPSKDEVCVFPSTLAGYGLFPWCRWNKQEQMLPSIRVGNWLLLLLILLILILKLSLLPLLLSSLDLILQNLFPNFQSILISPSNINISFKKLLK